MTPDHDPNQSLDEIDGLGVFQVYTGAGTGTRENAEATPRLVRAALGWRGLRP